MYLWLHVHVCTYIHVYAGSRWAMHSISSPIPPLNVYSHNKYTYIDWYRHIHMYISKYTYMYIYIHTIWITVGHALNSESHSPFEHIFTNMCIYIYWYSHIHVYTSVHPCMQIYTHISARSRWAMRSESHSPWEYMDIWIASPISSLKE